MEKRTITVNNATIYILCPDGWIPPPRFFEAWEFFMSSGAGENCKYHREDGLPAIEYNNGTKFWYVDGQLHRENGNPSCVYNTGETEYFFNGKLHRYNGYCSASLQNVYGSTYFIHGNEVDAKQYLSWVEEQGMDVNNLSDNDKTLIDIKWG